jgi:hypothetical protein
MATKQLSAIERAVLTGPGATARAAALVADDPEQRWMLSQDRDVRRSYAEQVLDRPGDPAAEERWMLLQPDDVCRSYAEQVATDPQERWLLRMPRAIRESYVHEVLGG